MVHPVLYSTILEQVWVWEYPTEDGDHHDLYMDIGEEIRFRVTSETFVDTSPCTEPKSEPQTQRLVASYKQSGRLYCMSLLCPAAEAVSFVGSVF